MKPSLCACPQPLLTPNPRDQGCGRCGRVIPHEWVAADKPIKGFFDRLAARWGVPGEAPPEFIALRNQCVARERAGREEFGLRYLGRNNPADAMEEAADLVNYCVFDVLASQRKGEDPDEDVALTAAWHVYEAYRSLLQLQRKHNGAA